MPASPPVLLASTSPYRQALLGRLLPDFSCVDPGVDETPLPAEEAGARALRLARLKAEAGAAATTGAVIIGSDQVASLDGAILRKPGDHARAVAQLTACSGRTVRFDTAVCVLAPGSSDSHVDVTRVSFRVLEPATIEAYLRREQPYDCAGSFKSEGLGVMLMDRIDNQDPTALQGLPLIWLAGCLQRFGVRLA